MRKPRIGRQVRHIHVTLNQFCLKIESKPYNTHSPTTQLCCSSDSVASREEGFSRLRLSPVCTQQQPSNRPYASLSLSLSSERNSTSTARNKALFHGGGQTQATSIQKQTPERERQAMHRTTHTRTYHMHYRCSDFFSTLTCALPLLLPVVS